ncbi:MAG: glycosyltransferase family 1 protein [Caldilineaceae bacterium]
MHIAINAQLLNTENSYRGAGVSNYAQQLLRAIGELKGAGETQHCFSAFINDDAFRCNELDLVLTSPALRSPLPRIVWEQTALPFALRNVAADLQHGLVNVLPLTSSVPGVVTVHDLSFIRMPEKFHRAKRAYLTALCRASVGRARCVLAVSQQTADDLIDFFNLPAHKVEVVHNGVAPEFSPGSQEENENFRRVKGLPERFLFYVGTLEPRKNLERLIRAYARWQQTASSDQSQVKLVLAGAKGWLYQHIFELVQSNQLQDNVIITGFVPHHELPQWYRAAMAFVYPSLFEGFGLPVLEAMACGTPVLCSNAKSLLEVAGDAALIFPAEDEDQLLRALQQISEDESLRYDLAIRGRQRASLFSWRRCAQETIAVYESVGR